MTTDTLDRRLMLSFIGTELPESVAATLARQDVSGVTLFRPNNYESPGQLRALSEALQHHRRGEEPLLIAIDQEGGQLHAFGAPATMWVGNMALGAAADVDLTQRVGFAIATELRAVGVNVNYAPVADLATNPLNPATGARSFGDDPKRVAEHVTAIIDGIQSAGVAATMKHFPGKGDSDVDSHHAMPVIEHDRAWLEGHEFLPFRAAVAAGVKLAMTGHFALPAITGARDLPCTLAVEANTRLLRDEMGFAGPLITDALDMNALSQGTSQVIDVIAAVRSGVDLLLMTADPEQEGRITTALALAMSRRLLDTDELERSDSRVLALRRWVAEFETPGLEVVGSESHEALNAYAAERSITLVKDDQRLLPVDTAATSIAVIEPETYIVTPADTSEFETPSLGSSFTDVLTHAPATMVYTRRPDDDQIAAAVAIARSVDIVVVATAAATIDEEQAALVSAVVEANPRTIAVAQRTPFDIGLYPSVGAFVCAWSVNPASMRAAARAICGLAPVSGRLPVPVAGFDRGHGLDRP